jgi:hypothetical protein
MKVVVHAFDNQGGAVWNSAQNAFQESTDIESFLGSWPGGNSSASYMAQLGLSFPSVAFGRYCPGGDVKYFAQLSGNVTTAQIVAAAKQLAAGPDPGCALSDNQPLPIVHTGTGTGTDTSQSSGSGSGEEDCWWEDLMWPIEDHLAFMCDIEKWVYLGLAALGTLKTMESATKAGQVGWGAVAAFSGYKSAEAFKLLPPSK